MAKLETKIGKKEYCFSEENLIAYEKSSLGAFELHKDYIVIYSNLFPFRNCTKGRFSTIIHLKDIQSVTYKGCGWLPGYLSFRYKHFAKRETFMFSVWFVSRRIKFNNNMMPIIDYINKVVMNSWNEESVRKIETVENIVKKGLCPYCGTALNEDVNFCGNCGNKVR